MLNVVLTFEIRLTLIIELFLEFQIQFVDFLAELFQIFIKVSLQPLILVHTFVDHILKTVETLVLNGLALLTIDVLADKGLADHCTDLLNTDRHIVPALFVHHI